MSELEHALELFGFLSIDNVTASSLKNAFKQHIFKAHPDRGGSAVLFDEMLQSYMYLTEVTQRISGGRTTLQNIITPDELKELRPDEIINRFFEEFDNEAFNKLFEEQYLRETHGYSTWLNNKDDSSNLKDGEFGSATQKMPTFDIKDLHNIFETNTKQGKLEPSAIILHPEQMAYISGVNIGAAIIETTEGGYSSDIFANPEYTDLYSAFTTNNTICDKIPTFNETNKSLDNLIAERNNTIAPFNDTELKAIQDYEKLKLDENIKNLARIKTHFTRTDARLPTTITNNWPPEIYSKEDYNGFVVDL
jgi:hypothetical protein